MDYKKKVEYVERVAEQLQGQKTSHQIRSELKEQGLFDRDVNNVMVSARKIIGEKYKPLIREYILGDKQIKGADAFSSLDESMLDTLVVQETKKLSLAEKKKVTKLLKNGIYAEAILGQVDTRFLSREQVVKQISELEVVQERNSTGMRSIYIFGGIGMLFLTFAVMLASGRLFFALPFIGVVLLGKGLTTERMAYDD